MTVYTALFHQLFKCQDGWPLGKSGALFLLIVLAFVGAKFCLQKTYKSTTCTAGPVAADHIRPELVAKHGMATAKQQSSRASS